jgi:hypothetical protein
MFIELSDAQFVDASVFAAVTVAVGVWATFNHAHPGDWIVGLVMAPIYAGLLLRRTGDVPERAADAVRAAIVGDTSAQATPSAGAVRRYTARRLLVMTPAFAVVLPLVGWVVDEMNSLIWGSGSGGESIAVVWLGLFAGSALYATACGIRTLRRERELGALLVTEPGGVRSMPQRYWWSPVGTETAEASSPGRAPESAG